MEMQRRVTQVLIPYAMESFRNLDVPLAQLKSLFIIVTKGDANLKTLADDLGVTPGNVTRIIDRLTEQGLVSREPDPGDRRMTRLGATDKGRELLTGLMEGHAAMLSEMLEYMNEEDLECYYRGLSGLARAVEEHRADSGPTLA